MWSDLRYAFRQLRKSPAFATTAVLTLGLGIGAATAMFSIVDAVLLQPLPYAAADRLVRIYAVTPDDPRSTFSGPDYRDFAAAARVFTTIAAYRHSGGPSLKLPSVPAVRLEAVLVTPGYFDVFGVPATLGRTFRLDDAKAGTRAVVLSDAVWQRHFGRRSSVIGETVSIDGEPHLVIGVMPAGFGFPTTPDVWMVAQGDVPESPFTGEGDLENDRDVHYMAVVARLAPGVDLATADAAARTIAARLEQAHPVTNARRSVRLVPLHEDSVGDVQPALLTLLAAVGVVLGVVAVNIASLLIARGTARQREMSIRAAVGASRGRLLRQLLIESLVLGVAGGLAGFTLALWALELLVALGPGNVPRLADAEIDVRVFGFSSLLSICVAVAFGLLPAIQSSRADIVSVFRQSIGGGGARQRLRSILVAVELAASVVLLVLAGLVGRSFLQLQRVELGYDVEHVYTMGLPLPETRYGTGKQQSAFYDQLLSRIDALPGVASVAATFPRPLSGGRGSADFEVEGRPMGDRARQVAGINWVTPEYFNAMRIRLVSGRVFDDRDREGSQAVIIVNERMARRYWPDGIAVGRRVRFGTDGTEPWHEVIGVVGNTRVYTLHEPPEPEIYVPHAQMAVPFMTLVVRTSGDTSALLELLRAQIAALDPNLPSGELTPLTDDVDEQLAPSRFRTILLAGFGAAALLLAGIGVYGLISYSVAQRTPEIGVRLALGASGAQVRRLVMRNGMALALAGLGAGLVIAFLASRWMASLLFGVRPADPLTMFGVVVLLLGVALAASYLPARRAMGIDPATALRSE